MSFWKMSTKDMGQVGVGLERGAGKEGGGEERGLRQMRQERSRGKETIGRGMDEKVKKKH